MQPAENKDNTRDLLLRISPSRNTLVVEEHKPGGIISYREIDPLELYYIFNGSYASNESLDSGFLPENCLHVSVSGAQITYVLWNPELRADIIYGDTEYQDFPIPRLVFGVRMLDNGKVVDCTLGVVADERPSESTQIITTPFPTFMRTAGCVRETMYFQGTKTALPCATFPAIFWGFPTTMICSEQTKIRRVYHTRNCWST